MLGGCIFVTHATSKGLDIENVSNSQIVKNKVSYLIHNPSNAKYLPQ
jgi:hypothetical protein